MGAYLLCLLVCDLAPTLSAMTNLNWALRRKIFHSMACDFQGALNQVSLRTPLSRGRVRVHLT